MSDKIVILVTCNSRSEAEKISRILVEARLIACANIVPSVQSIFRWQGEVCNEQEVLIIMKSVKTNLDRIIAKTKAVHSYDVPEIIALPIVAGSSDYLKWVEQETRKNGQ